eukprot:CAMPEP_0175076328 /NCGR_PEP_ID=MMETSP0052_2-20121109/22654_1 /TAXON_ID=51329 ORGANISM="Polytomella parva, Strain SAG 63-3" /NCGR_SAMPLE_ID=MMETSP0052_2 /ASSEMBLY_ACC=CAM_ASM_000194 /LENGTH=243 /DNA_ID=CAMNT_0016345431 /DNA_START=51 /DNA_END=779 /DNA_ORIENTATION=+
MTGTFGSPYSGYGQDDYLVTEEDWKAALRRYPFDRSRSRTRGSSKNRSRSASRSERRPDGLLALQRKELLKLLNQIEATQSGLDDLVRALRIWSLSTEASEVTTGNRCKWRKNQREQINDLQCRASTLAQALENESSRRLKAEGALLRCELSDILSLCKTLIDKQEIEERRDAELQGFRLRKREAEMASRRQQHSRASSSSRPHRALSSSSSTSTSPSSSASSSHSSFSDSHSSYDSDPGYTS